MEGPGSAGEEGEGTIRVATRIANSTKKPASAPQGFTGVTIDNDCIFDFEYQPRNQKDASNQSTKKKRKAGEAGEAVEGSTTAWMQAFIDGKINTMQTQMEEKIEGVKTVCKKKVEGLEQRVEKLNAELNSLRNTAAMGTSGRLTESKTVKERDPRVAIERIWPVKDVQFRASAPRGPHGKVAPLLKASKERGTSAPPPITYAAVAKCVPEPAGWTKVTPRKPKSVETKTMVDSKDRKILFSRIASFPQADEAVLMLACSISLQKASVRVWLSTREEADMLCSKGLTIGRKRHEIKMWHEAGPGTVCQRCCGIGHDISGRCDSTGVQCTICAEKHATKDHACNVKDCKTARGVACAHTNVKCANCGGKHHATAFNCPKRRRAE
ncbi:MAG: hypothetical protein MMC33_010323, partial [Icmadophila ericetorum]|nr:hypothetical protein [Icmadophila ericetorum]